MDYICLSLPVQPDRVDDTRKFLSNELPDRLDELADSQAALGIVKEHWFLEGREEGATLIGYIESLDFAKSAELMAASKRPFDVWFKSRLRECTGADLEGPPTYGLPEPLITWSAR